MSTIKVTVEHAGAHEPSGDTFSDDFSKALTKALAADGLKRAQGAEPKIVGYTQTSGVETVYNVELDTEARADAAKADDDKAKSNTGGGADSADAKNAKS